MLLRGMKDDNGKANEQDYDVFHHDEGRKRQDDFSVDVRNLVDALRNRGNPFLEAGVDLVNLDGRISTAKDISAIYDIGKDQYDTFVNDVIVTKNTPLDSPIKNNAFQLFKITKRRKAQAATEGSSTESRYLTLRPTVQLIHQLDVRGTGTFEQFTQRLFLKHFQVELRKVSRLDIVWDTYRPMSIMGHTRDERGHGVRLKVGPNVRIPGN